MHLLKEVPMSRYGHGYTPSKSNKPMMASMRRAMTENAAKSGVTVDETGFNYLFPDLQSDPNNRLPETPEMVAKLKALGETMRDADIRGEVAGRKHDSKIPAAFTYFGQFLDHDITLDASGITMEELGKADLKPRPSLQGLINGRSATLDLDSVYAGPRDGANSNKMLVGPVTALNSNQRPTRPVPGKSRFNDLPRQPRSADRNEDRAAKIGDARNDENTIVAQLHTAYLKAHNTLVDRGMNFDQAKKEIIKRHQSIVINDFLPKICDPKVVSESMKGGGKYYGGKVFMPVEFAVAGYRFGHSMVRTAYNFNNNFNFSPDEGGPFPATLDLLFTFTALSGQLGGGSVPADFDTLPENWVIEWERIAEVGSGTPQMARSIDTQLTSFLFDLRNPFGQSASADETTPPAIDIAPKLAVRNLLRGYHLGLPTGQAVAKKLGVPVLTGNALIDALPSPEQKAAAEPFKDRTPLWFYILAEAGNPNGANGQNLGAVGSWIVAETLVGLIRQSEISILGKDADGALANFKLSDLLKLAAEQDVAQVTSREPMRRAG
jgi:hypothetical protein